MDRMKAADPPARLSARAQQRRVSVPHAIAEGVEDVSAISRPLEPPETPPAPALPLPPSDHTASVARARRGEPDGEDAASNGHRQDPQALFWFAKPRLMLRIFRCATSLPSVLTPHMHFGVFPPLRCNPHGIASCSLSGVGSRRLGRRPWPPACACIIYMHHSGVQSYGGTVRSIWALDSRAT